MEKRTEIKKGETNIWESDWNQLIRRAKYHFLYDKSRLSAVSFNA